MTSGRRSAGPDVFRVVRAIPKNGHENGSRVTNGVSNHVGNGVADGTLPYVSARIAPLAPPRSQPTPPAQPAPSQAQPDQLTQSQLAPSRPVPAPPSAPPTTFSPNYRWLLLLVIGLAVLGFGSLMTLVNAALVPIADDLNTTVPTAGWVMTGLMLAMAVSTPAGGKLADIYGHRRIFMLGLVGMTAMTLLNYWVWNIEVFIAIRVVFGICGGLTMPSGMALLMHAFGPEQRARAVGWFQFAMTGAPTLGVVAGGPLLNVFGWREIFLAFGVISTFAVLMSMLVVKPIPRGQRSSIDILGALLLAGTTLGVLTAITRITAITRVGDSVLADRPILLMVGGSVASLVLFILWEKRASSPLLDLHLFRRATFTLPLASAAFNQFAYMGAFVIVPGLLQGPYGYAVGTAALLMAPRPGVFALSSPLGGSLVTSLGPRIPMLFGSTAMVASMLAFAAGSDPGSVGLTLVIVGLVLSGVSAGLGSPAYQVMVANSVEDKDLGVANGMNQTVMWIGIVLGIQTMLAFAGDDPSLGRLRSTFFIGAVVAALGYIAPLFATTRRRSRPVSRTG